MCITSFRLHVLDMKVDGYFEFMSVIFQVLDNSTCKSIYVMCRRKYSVFVKTEH